ncbi:MAG: choice-of-anchor D domain-containing protein [Halioglobus sp.]
MTYHLAFWIVLIYPRFERFPMCARVLSFMGVLLSAVVFSAPALAVDCPGFSTTLNSQAQVNAFTSGCDNIRGNLTIREIDPNAPITDLLPLKDLQTIGRNLVVRDNSVLSNVDGLVNVTTIGRGIDFRDNAGLLDVDGLSSVSSVARSIRFEDNAALDNLDGFSNISELSNGFLRIRDNASLSSLSGLSALSRVSRYVYIYNNDTLTNLAGLGALESIGTTLTLQNNNELADISALGNLATIGQSLVIRNNDKLINLAGLERLTTIPLFLNIRDNNLLTDLGALSAVTSVGRDLLLRNNDSLGSLAGLDSLASVTRNVQVRDHAILTDMSALGGLAVVTGYLEVRNNDDLLDLAGLEAIASVGGNLIIRDNNELLDVSATAAITSVGGELRIQNNDKLPNLNGMDKLTSVSGNVFVRLNNILDACNALIPLLDQIDDLPSGPGVPPTPDVLGNITIAANGGVNCNTQAGILASAVTPDFTQSFTPTLISVSATIDESVLEYVIDNSLSASRTTGVGFTNTLPAGVRIAPDPNAVNACMSGTLTAAAGTTTVSLTGATVSAASSCSVSLNVVGEAEGDYLNTSGALEFTLPDLTTGSGGTSSATLFVDDTPPVITIPGDNPLTIPQGSVFADPAVTAVDAIDGPVPVTPSGTVDTSMIGMYTRSYAAQDSVGNADSADLIVDVVEPPTPVVSLTPANIDFGDVVVDQTSAPQVVTLANTGTAELSVSAISAAAAPFNQSGGSCAAVPFTLAVGEDCTLEYTFTPTGVGPTSESPTITSNASTSPDSIALQGNGVQAGLSITPATLDFGDVVVDQTSAAQVVTLANTGTAELSVSAISAAAAPFDQSGGSCAAVPFTLAVGEDCTLEYTFIPTVDGPAKQSLEITSDAPTSPSMIALAGNGVTLYRSYSGPLPSGGPGMISFTTADPSCEFETDPQFLPEDSASEAPPSSIELVDGIVSFAIAGCAPGATVSVTVDYGTPLEAGDQYWKVDAAGWRQLSATISNSEVLFDLTDGGANDEDGLVNGRIVDPSGAASPVVVPTPARSIPVSNSYTLLMLVFALGLLANRRLRVSVGY